MMNADKTKRLSILGLSFDWRDIFKNNFPEFMHKLRRNRLGVEKNDFYFVCWGANSYYAEKDNYKMKQIQAWPTRNRVWLDFLLIFYLPIIMLRRKIRPDLVWSRDFPFFFSAIVPKLFFGFKTAITLGSLPDTIVCTKRFPKMQFFYQKFSEMLTKHFIDFYFANGQNTKNYLLKIGIAEEKIKILTSDTIGQDIKYIYNVKEGDLKKKLRIKDELKIALYVGRLEPEKGLFDLIRVFSEIKIVDLVLVLVGDGKLKNRLIDFAKRLGVERKIFFAGRLEHDQIWQCYKDSDVFLFFSESEGVPSVIREAMFMGVPVIARDISGVREFIGHDGERGYYWNKKMSSAELGRKLVQCLNDSEEKKKMLERAKRNIEIEVFDKKEINDYIK